VDAQNKKCSYGNGATLSFQGISVQTDIRMYGQSHDNQNFSDQWVTKFSKVWGCARVPLVRSGSATVVRFAMHIALFATNCFFTFPVIVLHYFVVLHFSARVLQKNLSCNDFKQKKRLM